MWNYSMRDVPTLSGYPEAVKREAAIVPLKSGPQKGVKPVGARRNTHQIISRDEGTGVITVCEGLKVSDPHCYVRYYPDGRVEAKVPRYSSSLGFLGKLLGYELNVSGRRPWIHNVLAKHPVTGEVIKGSFPIPKDGFLRCAYVEPYRHDLQIIEPEFPQQRRTNRMAAKAVRARYRDFRGYLKGMISLNGGVTLSSEQIAQFWPNQNVPMLGANFPFTLAELFDLIDSEKLEARLQAAYWLMKTQVSYRRTYTRWGTQDNDPENLDADTKTILKAFDTLLLEFHADEVFYPETNYKGAVVK